MLKERIKLTLILLIAFHTNFLLCKSKVKFVINTTLPKCSKHADTSGEWKSMNLIYTNETERMKFMEHFYGGGPKEAIKFSNVWIPKYCSYHRFTNTTIDQCTDYLLLKQLNQRQQQHKFHHKHHLHLVFFGDSAMRGIINGLTRILSGSEIYGPCLSDICGRPGELPPSERDHNKVRIYRHKNITISFIYTKSLTVQTTLWHIETILREHNPYALILNTGAWDFDHIARAYRNHTAVDTCVKTELKEISKLRSSPSINNSMWQLSKFADQKKIRLIYRNNHYQTRFGAICADEEFENMIHGSHWEIWDNRNISKNSWFEQTYDGFHFDRHRIHTYDEHKGQRGFYIANKYEKPGQLEIQLAQSLLNLLFFDCINDDMFK